MGKSGDETGDKSFILEQNESLMLGTGCDREGVMQTAMDRWFAFLIIQEAVSDVCPFTFRVIPLEEAEDAVWRFNQAPERTDGRRALQVVRLQTGHEAFRRESSLLQQLLKELYDERRDVEGVVVPIGALSPKLLQLIIGPVFQAGFAWRRSTDP